MHGFSQVGKPDDTTEANALFGPPVTTFEEWLAANRGQDKAA
jgi:hypothetical protein